MSEDKSNFFDLTKVHRIATAMAITIGGIGGADITQRVTKVEDRVDAAVAVAATAASAQIQIVAIQDKNIERIAILESDIKRLEQAIANIDSKINDLRSYHSSELVSVREDMSKLRDRLEQLEVVIGALQRK